MQHASSIPAEILTHVPCKCCRIRNDNGVYRVYKYKATRLPSGKWGNTYGDLIGKILPDKGFIPNKRYLKELEEEGRPVYNEGITDVAYGQYALMMHLSEDVFQLLERFFPYEKAAQIYSYALILCEKGFVHVDQLNNFYQESILSIEFSSLSLKMGRTAISKLLHDLGSRGEAVKAFEQHLIDENSGSVALDGHVIRSCSEENDLAEPGYKMNLLKANQVNVLIAYDIGKRIPLAYRTYRGSSVDKSSVISFLKSRSFHNTKFVADRGFYSSAVIDLMTQNGNVYIMPVPSSTKVFKRIKATLAFTSGEFVYGANRKDSARIVYYEEQIDKRTRVIVFKDEDENNSKRKNYLHLMALGETGYSMENYEKHSPWWGVYFLQTTAEESAADVFRDYKNRWSIETYNNYIKNIGCFNNLKIQDYYVEQGFNFIMLVTGLIHSKLNEAVKTLGNRSISTCDILQKAGCMRMVKGDEGWTLQNTRKKDIELFEKLAFVPALHYKTVHKRGD